MSTCARPVRPRVPITISSALAVCAASRIAVSARPLATIVSTAQPAIELRIRSSFSRAERSSAFSIAARVSSALPDRSGGISQLCWTIRVPPVFSTSRRAQASARSASGEKSLGTSTRR
ncbi:MAG: hypothetical protein FJ108_07250 [Deltaproteobacteria bacterium]|nr:hypothetical protein [Deltaproteobacteria bacterium]